MPQHAAGRYVSDGCVVRPLFMCCRTFLHTLLHDTSASVRNSIETESKMKTFTTGCALALLGLTCTVAVAQDTTNKKAETPKQQRLERAEARAERVRNADEEKLKKHSDKAVAEYFAGKLMLMDQSTIQLAKLAEERSTNVKVKEFAKMLIDEHTKCSEKLRESAPDVVGITELDSVVITRAAGYRGNPDSDDKANTVDKPAQAATNPERNSDGSEKLVGDAPTDTDEGDGKKRVRTANEMTALHRVLAIDREATRNYIQSSSDMLEKYQGQDFDMGFLGFTIGSHTWALAELKALDSVGDEKFQKLIRDASMKVEQHLTKAQELSKEFENEYTQRGNAARPATSTGTPPVPEK